MAQSQILSRSSSGKNVQQDKIWEQPGNKAVFCRGSGEEFERQQVLGIKLLSIHLILA